QAALGQYRSLVYYGLPLDYFSTYVDHVDKVSEGDVKQSASKHLQPGPAIYVVVGDGNAKMIRHEPSANKDDPADKRRPPLEQDGKQLTLREALQLLATKGDVGPGGFVELDVDGKTVRNR